MSNRVAYFYDCKSIQGKHILGEVGSFYYGPEHPMKPFRIKMAHQLILSYGLYRKMSVYVIIQNNITFDSNPIGLQIRRCAHSIHWTILSI
jgi:hypothetical protein